MKQIVAQEIQLHKRGFSTMKIAKKLGIPKNNIICNLRNHGILRKAPGRDTEEQVAKWFEKQGIKVERQRGDAPFDLLMMQEKYDVKSANIGKDHRYTFQIYDKSNHKGEKDLSQIDIFLLVLLSLDGKPMYKLKSCDLTAKYSLHIPEDIKKSKYNLQFIGYLEKIVR